MKSQVSHHLQSLFLAVLGVTCLDDVRADDLGPGNIDVRGLIDIRLALTDEARGWEDRGFGKTRFGAGPGGERRELVRAEGSMILRTRLTWDLTAIAHVTANAEQRTGVDVVEAFLLYKPAPTSAVRWRARAGAFFPPLSLENTGLAWTSPFTISSSAINSWIGEELRAIGAEGTLAHGGEDGEFSVSAAAFGSNDPAGSVLAWRGWAVHDREAGLFERLPLVALPGFAAGGSAPGQAQSVQPFAELDNRIGFYAAAQWQGANSTTLRAMYYDNQADSLVFDGRQYAWHTTFLGVSSAAALSANITIVAQAMSGRTIMAAFPTFTVVDNDFSAASLLASRDWGRHRISARIEAFEVKDRDATRDDPNGEHGRALTAAYVFRPTDDQRLTLELLNVRSNRASRSVLGLPGRTDETLVQLSYRYFFGG
jgi:hypothetical protein